MTRPGEEPSGLRGSKRRFSWKKTKYKKYPGVRSGHNLNVSLNIFSVEFYDFRDRLKNIGMDISMIYNPLSCSKFEKVIDMKGVIYLGLTQMKR